MLFDYKNKSYEKKKINDNIELDNKEEAHQDNINKNTIRDKNNKMEIE